MIEKAGKYILKPGALKAIELLVIGGIVTATGWGIHSGIRNGIREENKAMVTQIVREVIKSTSLKDSAIVSNLVTLTDIVEGIDSTVNKTSDKEKQEMRREIWRLRREKFLNQEKKNETQSLNSSSDCQPELSLENKSTLTSN